MKNIFRFLLTVLFMFSAVAAYSQRTYKVLLCLNYDEYEEVYDTIDVNYGLFIKLPATWKIPQREGYKFRGYYDGRDYSAHVSYSNQYIDPVGQGIKRWDYGRDYIILYAHWTPKRFVLTFNTLGGRLSEEVGIRTENANKYVATLDNRSKVNVNVEYGSRLSDRWWCQKVITIKPGYEFLGWYNSPNKEEGTQIFAVHDVECSFDAIKSEYWSNNGTEGIWIKDLGEDGDTLEIFAHYDKKFEIVEDGDRINFFDMDIQAIDIEGAIKEDNTEWNASPLVLDITQYKGYIQPGPDMEDSLGHRIYDGGEAFRYLLDYTKKKEMIEPNCLTYLSPKTSFWSTLDNVVRMSEKKCSNFVLTDRRRIKIPYSFTAQSAIYERDKGYDESDAAVKQAINSHWGTFCLPFPVSTSQPYIELYRPHGVNRKTHEIKVQKYNNHTIQAGSPCIYQRKDGKVSSKITIIEQNVVVPVNTTNAVTTVTLPPDWEFKGTYVPLMFLGPDHPTAKHPTTEIVLEKNRNYDIYYYKQDKFTLLQNNGSLYMHPFRVYFVDNDSNANGSKSSYSLVVDDDLETSGIKEVKDGTTKVIYTLSGMRVNTMKPGNTYIINGKKYLYK